MSILWILGLSLSSSWLFLRPPQLTRVLRARISCWAAEAEISAADMERAKKEIAELEELAAKEDANAQFRLGQVLRKGRFVEQDLIRAFQLIFDAAQQDHAASEHVPAQLKLGEMLLKGEGVKRNETLAARYFMLAAKEGSVQAQEVVGQLLRTGTGLARDEDRRSESAADQGNEEACLTLAAMCRKGEGSPRDPAAALRWFEKAAKSGNPEAANELGVMYLCGEGTMSDEERRRPDQ
eukprot:g18270.t1